MFSTIKGVRFVQKKKKRKTKLCRRCCKYRPFDHYDPTLPAYRAITCKKCLLEELKGEYKPDNYKYVRRKHKGLATKYKVPIRILEEDIAKGCNICGTNLNRFSPSGHARILHIDHCHKTGRYRGTLCNKCNTMLGMCSDNPDVLANAIEYLKTRGKDNHYDRPPLAPPKLKKDRPPQPEPVIHIQTTTEVFVEDDYDIYIDLDLL